MQMNDRVAAARYLGVSTCEKTLARNVEGTTRTIHDRNRVASDPVKGFTSASPGNWGSGIDARSSANLFVIECGPKRKNKKREGRRPSLAAAAGRKRDGEEEAMEERSCFAYRRIYEPAEPVVSLSPGGKFQPPNSGLWYRRKVAALCFPLSLTRYNTANQRSRWGCSSSISLSLSLFLPASGPFLGLISTNLSPAPLGPL